MRHRRTKACIPMSRYNGSCHHCYDNFADSFRCWGSIRWYLKNKTSFYWQFKHINRIFILLPLIWKWRPLDLGHLPAHVFPSPFSEYPELHVHLKLPYVFTQPCAHPEVPSVHSSTSRSQTKNPWIANKLDLATSGVEDRGRITSFKTSKLMLSTAKGRQTNKKETKLCLTWMGRGGETVGTSKRMMIQQVPRIIAPWRQFTKTTRILCFLVKIRAFKQNLARLTSLNEQIENNVL